MSDAADSDDPAGDPPASLREQLLADPLRAPEHIALAAAEHHAPAATRWVKRHDLHPIALGEMARRRHAAMAGVGGAATGVGGLMTMIPDLVSLAWIQSRLVFFVAAAYGWDPFDRMRPAELLALTGLYSDPVGARAALDRVGTSVAEHWVGSKLARDEALSTKLIVMVGASTGKKIAGRMIPGFAIAFNAVSNRRETNALGRRAVAFYGQTLLPPAAR